MTSNGEEEILALGMSNPGLCIKTENLDSIIEIEDSSLLLNEPVIEISTEDPRPKRLHVTCAVSACPSPKRGVSYHRFPRDQKLNKKWRILCGSGDVKEPRICSRHFKPEDFKRDLVNELLNLPQKRLLKSDALPSLYLTKDQKDPPKLSKSQIARKEREERRLRAELVERLLTSGPDPPPAPAEPKFKDIAVQVLESSSCEHRGQVSRLSSCNKRLQATIAGQKSKIAELRSVVRKMQSSKYVEPLLSEVLQKSFTKTQADVILHQKKVKKWSVEDVINALHLRQMSPKTYGFIRRCGHFPLPGLSTLRNWIRTFQVSKGVQEHVWTILKERLRTEKDKKFKLASIVFDEIDCNYSHQYTVDNESQQLGEFPPRIDRMQVVILRGLVSKWKYVIFQDFDFAITKPLLDQIIVTAEEIGFQIWTMSLDIDNKEVMEDVIIKNSCFSFSNPYDESRQVYVFPSMPPIIRHFRNHVLDQGILLDPVSDTILCRRDFELVLSDPNKESNAPRLKNFHLLVQGSDRRRNRPALQLFSSSVGKSMKSLGVEEEKIIAVERLDAYVDVFNSRLRSYKNKAGAAFGLNLEEQKDALRDAEDLAMKMRIIDPLTGQPEMSMLPFQYGMIIGIQSLIELYNEVVARRGLTELLFTGHLNTDVVHNYFSKLGGYLGVLDHAGPEDILKKSRLVMIGRKAILPTRSIVLDALLEEENNIDSIEPLFGTLPKKPPLKKKKTIQSSKKKSDESLVKKRRKISEDDTKIKKKKAINNTSSQPQAIIKFPPEIYTF